jgi:hypothetical protein
MDPDDAISAVVETEVSAFCSNLQAKFANAMVGMNVQPVGAVAAAQESAAAQLLVHQVQQALADKDAEVEHSLLGGTPEAAVKLQELEVQVAQKTARDAQAEQERQTQISSEFAALKESRLLDRTSRTAVYVQRPRCGRPQFTKTAGPGQTQQQPMCAVRWTSQQGHPVEPLRRNDGALGIEQSSRCHICGCLIRKLGKATTTCREEAEKSELLQRRSLSMLGLPHFFGTRQARTAAAM